jgi:hypothetical protein
MLVLPRFRWRPLSEGGLVVARLDPVWTGTALQQICYAESPTVGPMRAVDRGRRSQPAVAGGLAPPAGLNHELSTGAVAGRGATIDEVRRSRSTRGQPILWVSCVACVMPRGSSVTAHTSSDLVGYDFSHELVYFMWPFVALSSVSSAGPLDKWRRRF